MLAALALSACSETEGGNDGPPPLALPKAAGNCPGQMFVGIPVTLNFRVTNPGKKAYPATYFAFDDGAGPFVINTGSSDGAPGIERDMGQGGWEFRGYLGPGKSRNIRVTMTPKDAGNFDPVVVSMWGGKEGMDRKPITRTSDYECDVAINPGF